MIIKEAVWEKCTTGCGNRTRVSDEEYGCDECEKEIDFSNHESYLDITVFREDSEKRNENLHFCSWKCLFKKLPTIECDHFINIPYITFDGPDNKTDANAFFEAIEAFKR